MPVGDWFLAAEGKCTGCHSCPAESRQQNSWSLYKYLPAAAVDCKSCKSRTSLIDMSSPRKCDLLLRREGNVKACRPTRSHRQDWRVSQAMLAPAAVRTRTWNSKCPLPPPHQLWRMWWWKMNQPHLWRDSLPMLNLTPLLCQRKEISSNLSS